MNQTKSAQMTPTAATRTSARIRHTVVFRLKHPVGSAAQQSFLQAAMQLARSEGVERFECLRQISTKNSFTFGLSMEFADEAAYGRYSANPDHERFVRERWLPEVAEFMEIDYTVLEMPTPGK